MCICQPVISQLFQIIQVNIAVIGKVGSAVAAEETTVGSKPAFGKYSKIRKPYSTVTIEVCYKKLPGQFRIIGALTDAPDILNWPGNFL